MCNHYIPARFHAPASPRICRRCAGATAGLLRRSGLNVSTAVCCVAWLLPVCHSSGGKNGFTLALYFTMSHNLIPESSKRKTHTDAGQHTLARMHAGGCARTHKHTGAHTHTNSYGFHSGCHGTAWIISCDFVISQSHFNLRNQKTLN
jgi:hypothetical protein